MKLLSRDFTVPERILIIVLAVILVGLAYYWFVDQPVRAGIESARMERDALEDELNVIQTKILQLQRMQDELDSMGALSETSRMESYNNSKQELTLLNNILQSAYSYSVSFQGVSRDGDQVRRSFSLSFTTLSYESAKDILRQLSTCEQRCLLGNLSYSISDAGALVFQYPTGTLVSSAGDYTVSISVTATFYETMYGGTPDAGLT